MEFTGLNLRRLSGGPGVGWGGGLSLEKKQAYKVAESLSLPPGLSFPDPLLFLFCLRP